MKIVVTGAHGFLGSDLSRRFALRGDEVTAISRSRPEETALSAFHPASLGQALPSGTFTGADLVVHAAHDRRPGAEELNVAGTRAWEEQARHEGARSQVFLTSVSAHPDAPSEYGRAKARLEDHFKATGGLLVRPGLVVGPGGTFGDMARMARMSPLLPVLGGDGLQVVLTDLDAIFNTVAAFQDLEPGSSYNLFQPEWVGLLSLMRALGRHFKRKALFVPLPVGPSLALLGLGQKLGLPPSLGPESLKNLQRCRAYGYVSSYQSLGLPIKPLEVMLKNAFPL